MAKIKLKIFLKAANELLLVFLQFFIISLHFFKLEFLPQKQIIQESPFSYFLGILIIISALIIMLVSIKDLGRNFSPFPRPINNLVTTGIYRFTRHPMYYSLIFISIGVFIIKLSIYYLFLTISLALVIKFKIALEEQYLMNKFKNYLIYKNHVKV